MTELDINQVMTWSLGQLYNYVKTIEEDLNEEEQELIKKCEKGELLIPIHINYYIKEYYQEYPSSKKASIMGFGKIHITTLWKDIELRETTIRKIILDNLEEDSPTEGRIQ